MLQLKTILPGKPFKINSYTITAYKVNHSVHAVGYIIEDKKGKRLLYTGDTGPTDEIWEVAKDIQCAIIEVSFPDKLKAMAIKTGHLTAGLLMKEISKMFVATQMFDQHIAVNQKSAQELPFLSRAFQPCRV